jgi:hypothetical protein
MEQKITPEFIEKLNKNEIFVFASNEGGKHFGGAAKTAVKNFGAVLFKPEGLQGKSYAIPTMDKNMKTLTPLKIKRYVNTFIEFAKSHPHLTFYLTKIGTGIAGVPIETMKDICKDCVGVENIAVPIEFL